MDTTGGSASNFIVADIGATTSATEPADNVASYYRSTDRGKTWKLVSETHAAPFNSVYVDGNEQPIITASNIHYELAERTRGIAAGGLGAIHLVAGKLGLAEAIDRQLHLLSISSAIGRTW